MKRLLTLALFTATMATQAQNPIINSQFTADPTARVFNGRVYLYPSHDIPSPIEPLKEWFCMADYHVFSSSNLTDWTDHGMIVSQTTVPWVNPESYTMWAPDCVCKDGRYYFYFPAAPKGEQRGFRIGVAISDSPTGPFFPMPKPIEGIMGIDPCVLVDDDGQAYIYWSGMGIRGARLTDNMTQLASEPVQITGLPEGFKEGPYIFKRGSHYYCTFPWVRNVTETLAYAMSDSPLGPYEFKGIIMDESPTGCWTNHHSITQYNGQWYLFYHHNDYSPQFDKNRSVRIDSLHFEPDGTIRKVTPTLRGVGITDPNSKIQIDRYSDISPKKATIQYLDPQNPFEGWKVIMKNPGAYVRYNTVDFTHRPVTSITARVRAPKGATITVATPKAQIAEIPIPPVAGWTLQTIPVATAPDTITDIIVTLKKGRNAEIDWIGFDALPWAESAFQTRRYRNLFAEMGYHEDLIQQRLDTIFNALFHGPDKVYFEDTDTTAYISDLKNHDVRTEGMSYGMMAAVQLDKKEIFDRLWRWSKTHMQHHSGPAKGYFAWSCRTDGTPNSRGAASDGELYFVTSLIFAANRWGCNTGIDYLAEARHIIDSSMAKLGHDNAAPLINPSTQLITFTPDNWGGRHTDPSYHVPAFFEVWARWLGDGRSKYWMECADKSRQYLHRCVHPVTALTPDYSNYDGTPLGGRNIIGDAFRFDSWRVPMNIALDYSWSGADRQWQREYADKLQNFLYSQGIDDFVDQYTLDGRHPETILQAGGFKTLRHSLGLVATSAAVSLAATDMRSREFAQRLWDARHQPYSDGYFDAYYDGFLRLFAFMHLSGNYRIIFPD